MRRKREAVRFSALALLETIWLRGRVRLNTLQATFPTTPVSVLWENLEKLTTAQLVRRRHVSVLGRPPYSYWRVTPRGRLILRKLEPVRICWELVLPRQLLALSTAEEVIDRLDRKYAEVFGKSAELERRSNYWDYQGPGKRPGSSARIRGA